jgi:hypothetical protein
MCKFTDGGNVSTAYVVSAGALLLSFLESLLPNDRRSREHLLDCWGECKINVHTIQFPTLLWM